MSEEMLVEILKEPKNAILKQYQKLLALDEVKLEFNDDALHAIAKKALKKDTGARALRAIIEEFMLDIMYEIPKDDNIGGYHHEGIYRRNRRTGNYVERSGSTKTSIIHFTYRLLYNFFTWRRMEERQRWGNYQLFQSGSAYPLQGCCLVLR